VILLVTGNIGEEVVWGEGLETTGKIRQIEMTENSLFYCSQTIYCSPEHTHTHILHAAFIFPNAPVDIAFATNVSYSVGNLIFIL